MSSFTRSYNELSIVPKLFDANIKMYDKSPEIKIHLKQYDYSFCWHKQHFNVGPRSKDKMPLPEKLGSLIN